MKTPEKENAAPANQDGGFDKHGFNATTRADIQAPESALALLCKAFARCNRTDRFHFLRDVRSGAPNLWRDVERDFLTGLPSAISHRK